MKLKPKDIDSKRNLIFVKGAKGRKDRYTILSDVALKNLRQYWGKSKPKKWLFPSQDKER
jgi:integrase